MRTRTASRGLERLDRGLRRDEGLTVVEVMVAAMILVIGALAVLQVVDVAARNNYRGEEAQVVSNRLQQEIEKIKRLPYAQLALTGLPQDTIELADPRWRTQGTNFAVTKQGGSPQPLIYDGGALYDGGTVSGGAVDPNPTPFTSGDVHGNVYRFVVWENDATCSEALCPGPQDLKRVIVAVRADTTASGGVRPYQEVQSQVVDPQVEPADNESPPPPGGDTSKPWTLFLTDTTCNNDTRQPVSGDHATQNTRAVCSSGVATGNTPGAPDLLYTSAPPLDPEAPIFDYATDVEPTVNPEQDKGLQMLPQSTSGCGIDALGVASGDVEADEKWRRVHRWLTPAIPSGYDILLNGSATLALWSQTVNSVSYPGQICIWLFKRQTDGQGVTTDTAIAPVTGGTSFTFSQSSWPTTWTELPISLSFQTGVHLLPGERLGLAIAIDPAGTGDGSQGLQFMYDEPSFDSRLEVKTGSTLPTF
jgi:Tfp pilus assembly major pilin PilA